MRFEDLKKDTVVFAYQISPDFGKEGDNGGFSLELFGNGNLRFATYKLFDEISLLKIFKLNKKETWEIFHVLQKWEHIWREIPEELDNRDKDAPGNINEFTFLNWKKIRAYNIKKTFLPGEALKNRKYYMQYRDTMKYENQVIQIFEEICKLLKRKEINLSLKKCKINEKCKVKVTWIDKTKE